MMVLRDPVKERSSGLATPVKEEELVRHPAQGCPWRMSASEGLFTLRTFE